MKQARNPEAIHPPVGRYVHHIEASGEKRLLFISGQVGKALGGTVPADPVEQFRIALENVLLNLEAAGFAPTDLVKLTTYVVGELDPAGRRATLDHLLGDHVTTSTLVFVAALASPEYRVEVDAWAVREG
jgi:enamine deaminase RidA (YjgF/YER057c/UK114 family)